MYKKDTICAISTGYGGAIIGIRVSGSDTFSIINNIIPRDINSINGNESVLTNIIENNQAIDQVILNKYINPRSYNGEDLVEIFTHGSKFVSDKIISILIKNGCRYAEPGEFTKRAFLNGKIDGLQSNAIINLIKSNNSFTHRNSINQLLGSFSLEIENITKDILDLIAQIEVNIDYPEYDENEEITKSTIRKFISNIKLKLDDLYSRNKIGNILSENIKVSIIGKPNVGKSSLMNQLTKADTSIISDQKGTTRDVVKETIVLENITIEILDTAGIREKTNDTIEKIGIEKSLSAIQNSDILLLLIDDSKNIDSEDKSILEMTNNKRRLIIKNKIDINSVNEILDKNEIKISTKNSININTIEKKIISIITDKEIDKSSNYFTTTQRQSDLIWSSLKIIEEILKLLDNNDLSIDIVSIDLQDIVSNLNKVIGKIKSESIIDILFENYCLGK